MTTGLYYFKVLLPLKLRWIPTYSHTEQLEAGQFVNVEFAHRSYVGVVLEEDGAPELSASRIQAISSIDTAIPPAGRNEISLWQFIAEYYLCTLGEVFRAACPSHSIRSEHAAAAAVGRLRERIRRKEEDLERKHSEKVLDRLGRELAALKQELEYALPHPAADVCAASPAGPPVLLQSGSRTESYRNIIRKTLADKGQILVLSPEIAFCNKLMAEIEDACGGNLHVVNSTRTPAERRDAAARARSGEPAVFLGTRSAIFLPFRNLHAIIIDEEQDSSYKQSEPAPRYNGRDAAIALAGIHGAQVTLGSSCPSLESLYNAMSGKYSIIQGEVPRSFMLIDTAAEKRKRGMNGSFSIKLAEAIREHRGPVMLIRGWEKEEELCAEAKALFPDRDITVCSLADFKSGGCAEGTMVVVMQSDALVSRDDFRCDERTIQLACMLCSLSDKVVIQCASSSRFNALGNPGALLAERKEFGFPPYTRVVDIRTIGSRTTDERRFLTRDRNLQANKKEIFNSLGSNRYADVDPA